MKNEYAAECATCGVRLEVGAGNVLKKTDSAWKVVCEAGCMRPVTQEHARRALRVIYTNAKAMGLTYQDSVDGASGVGIFLLAFPAAIPHFEALGWEIPEWIKKGEKPAWARIAAA